MGTKCDGLRKAFQFCCFSSLSFLQLYIVSCDYQVEGLGEDRNEASIKKELLKALQQIWHPIFLEPWRLIWIFAQLKFRGCLSSPQETVRVRWILIPPRLWEWHLMRRCSCLCAFCPFKYHVCCLIQIHCSWAATTHTWVSSSRCEYWDSTWIGIALLVKAYQHGVLICSRSANSSVPVW